MEHLGMGDIFHQIAEVPRGLVPVRGPSGSGRCTTLAAMMDCINDTKYEHILTIEDPIKSPPEQEMFGESARSAPGYAWL